MIRVNSRVVFVACVLLVILVNSVSFAGSLYVNLQGGDNDYTYRYDTTTGTKLYRLDPTNSIGFNGTMMAICVGPDSTGDGIGEVYRGGYYSANICKYDGATGDFISEVSTSALNYRVMGIGFGPDGDLYSTQFVERVIYELDPITGNFKHTMGYTDYPASITWGANGHAFVSSWVNNRVDEYDVWNGTTFTKIRTLDSGNAAGLSLASGIAFGPDGKLYVASGNNNKVVRFDATTGAYIDDFVTSGSGTLSGTRGLAFGDDVTGDGIADLYVASSGNNKILRYNGSTGAFIDIFATTDLAPVGIAYAPVVPEPGSLLALGSGLMGFVGFAIRRRK